MIFTLRYMREEGRRYPETQISKFFEIQCSNNNVLTRGIT